MQLAEAAEVFAAILISVGLHKVRPGGSGGSSDAEELSTEVTVRMVTSIKTLEVTLLTSSSATVALNVNTDGGLDSGSDPCSPSNEHSKSHPPVFVLDNLKVLLNGSQKPSIATVVAGGTNATSGTNTNSNPHCREQISTDVVFSVSLERLHQHVNFALVRLVLQIMETLDVIKEEEKFAAKQKQTDHQQGSRHHEEMVMLRFASVLSPFSSPGAALPKCWRNMYNVMNLYTTHTTTAVQNRKNNFNTGMPSRKSLFTFLSTFLYRVYNTIHYPQFFFIRSFLTTNGTERTVFIIV